MIGTKILFYNVGLNEKNLPYSFIALSNILAAGQITSGGQAYELHLTALPFGAVFNISSEVYEIVKSATYLHIINEEADNENATQETRFAFINNFLQIANGNYSVSYTIDDWTSFYLNPDSPYNMHIDGWVERGNIPLLDNQGAFTTDKAELKGNITGDIKSNFLRTTLHKPDNHGIALPAGYVCAVYFINNPKYNGTPSDAGQQAQGTVLDFNCSNGQFRTISRNNSCIYYMVFTPSGYNVGIYGKNSENDNYTEIIPYGNITINEIDDSTIEKIMYFDFIPTDDTTSWSNGFQVLNYQGVNIYGIAVGGTSENNLKLRLADITHGNDNIYYKALRIQKFAPVIMTDNNPFSLVCNGVSITQQTSYAQYIAHSLYRYIDEAQKIKVKYLTAQLEIPARLLGRFTKFIVCLSGDAETIILKMYNAVDTETFTNINSATGQNIDYFDLTLVRDFKSYKNAKITGAAGVAATAIGSVVALGSSIATGNVAGVVGSLAGGGAGVLQGVQKLENLTPSQQSPASGDRTLTKIINDSSNDLKCIITKDVYNPLIKIRYLEENGALISMPFDEYMTKCQMQAYNAIKMAYVDISGAPQQIARRIEEMFLNGLTLWTATDVGNKKVINYPLNS